MALLEDLNPEPGEWRCGNSYEDEITVTGELPNKFGKSNTHVLPPVAEKPTGDWFSVGSPEEAEFIAEIEAAEERFKEDLLDIPSGFLTPAEVTALWSIAALAPANIDVVEETYAYWRDLESEWPLPEGDILSKYIPVCTKSKRGTWQALYELQFQDVVFDRWYFCHDNVTLRKRADDRGRIHSLLLEAARAIRCAEWSLWRTLLYRQSLAEFEEIEVGDFLPTPTPDPLPPPPTGPMGTFKAEQREEEGYIPPTPKSGLFADPLPIWRPFPTKLPTNPANASIKVIDIGPVGPPKPTGPEGAPGTAPGTEPLPPAAFFPEGHEAPASPWPTRIAVGVGAAALIGYFATSRA